jgi:hypothetical protein
MHSRQLIYRLLVAVEALPGEAHAFAHPCPLSPARASINFLLMCLTILAAAAAEGHEYKVFSELSAKDPSLPRQISVEFHFNFALHQAPEEARTGAELVLGLLHLAQLGYAEYFLEVNPQGVECCSEFSFIRLV